MIEVGEDVMAGNRMMESRFTDILFNHRNNHQGVSTEIVDAMRRYLALHEGFEASILQHIAVGSEWSPNEIAELLAIVLPVELENI